MYKSNANYIYRYLFIDITVAIEKHPVLIYISSCYVAKNDVYSALKNTYVQQERMCLYFHLNFLLFIWNQL